MVPTRFMILRAYMAAVSTSLSRKADLGSCRPARIVEALSGQLACHHDDALRAKQGRAYHSLSLY